MDENLVINVIVGMISGIALLFSLYTFHESKSCKTYADLDNLYLELLKLGMNNPKFRDPKYTMHYKSEFKNGDELSKYEIYAFIAWNICETIYDRKDEAIFETWSPIIVTENKLHRIWFDEPENWHKFKQPFREYIHHTFPNDLPAIERDTDKS